MNAAPAPPGSWGGGHPDDLLASYALGALEPGERADVDAHVATCARCTAEMRRLRAAVDALPFAVAPVPPPPGSRAAVLRRIRGETEEPVPPPLPRRPPGWWRVLAAPAAGWAAAAAGVAAAAAGVWQAQLMRHELAALRAANQDLARAAREESLILASLDPGSTRFVEVRGSDVSPAAGGRVVYDARTRRALVVLEGLPPLEPGKTYQLWLLQGGGAAPLSAGTLRPEDDGLGTVVIQAPAQLDAFAGIGVTLESLPGSTTPLGPLVASGLF